MADNNTNDDANNTDQDGENETDDQTTEGETSSDSAGPALKADGTPFTAADLTKLNDSLKAARREARAAKKVKPEDSVDVSDVVKAVSEATAARDGHWKPLLVRTAAREAFVSAGLVLPKDNADAALARVVKLLDVEDLDISDDGLIEGLHDQVDEIKRDFPELFSTGSRRNGRVDASDKGNHSNGRVKTASERQAEQLLGR